MVAGRPVPPWRAVDPPVLPQDRRVLFLSRFPEGAIPGFVKILPVMSSGKGRAETLPGQTMDLDEVSEDDKDAILEVPVTGKRKSEAGASPAKRGGDGGDAFSWQSFKNLLADQTKELQAWYREEMGGAIRQSEEKVMKAVSQVTGDLAKTIEEGNGKIEKVETAMEDVLVRLGKLESEPKVANHKGGSSSIDRGPSLVFGGWRMDTKKTLILADLTAVLKDAQVDGLLDAPAWVPAVRHSVAIAEFTLRKDENADGQRTRMMAIIAAVNAARVQSENTAEGKNIWAAVSRPRSERGPGYHCGKTRKVFYELNIGVSEVECAYSTGSTWFKDKLVASVEKPQNNGAVAKGLMDHSWFDATLVAQLSGKSVKEVQTVWDRIVQG